jgi:hypothetical protein
MVAQFAQRWGTRYTPHGKIIWAELAFSALVPSQAPQHHEASHAPLPLSSA